MRTSGYKALNRGIAWTRLSPNSRRVDRAQGCEKAMPNDAFESERWSASVSGIVIKHLAEQRHVLPKLRAWFESEWPAYYGAGGHGNAEQDLLAYANSGSVPFGLVAFRQDKPCGFVALKREAFPSHPHLFPWAGAAYVEPSLRMRRKCLTLERDEPARLVLPKRDKAE